MLTVDALTVTFGSATAVDGATFEVPGGTVLGVMGPSGCGKTTLLRAIAGLEPIAAGSIAWAADDVTRLPVHHRNFGLMFQDYALFPHRSVAGNVAFGLHMRRLPEREVHDRVAEMLALVDLEGLGDRSVGTLSGGQQQRVALARTLAPSPRLVLLDEPLGALDRTLRDQLVTDMRAIFAGLGTTAVYVTHDRDEAFAVADRVALMMAGRIERSGRPEDLWADPGTVANARFLGMANVLAAGEAAGWITSPDDTRHVAIDPAAVSLAPGGGGRRATVVASRFRGGTYQVSLQVGGGPTLATTTEAPLEAGTEVGVLIDPAGVIPLR